MSRFRLTSPGKIQLAESDVAKACLDLLRMHHWWPIRQHVGLFKTPDGRWIRMGEVGDPDYAVIRTPSFFLEFKRPGGELSDEQRERIFRLEKFYSMQTIVVASVEELRDWLQGRHSGP